MKTIKQAIAERGPQWGGMFDALYWNEAEGYYFAAKGYCVDDFVCYESEYKSAVKEQNLTNANKHNAAQGNFDLTERLIISEIGDFSASLPGGPITGADAEQLQQELIARVQRVFADVRLQVGAE